MEMIFDDMIDYFKQFLIGGEKINHGDKEEHDKKNILRTNQSPTYSQTPIKIWIQRILEALSTMVGICMTI